MRRLLVLLGAGVLLVLAGCAQGQRLHATTVAGAALTATYAPLAATTDLPQESMTLAAPSNTDVQATAVTPQQAFGTCSNLATSCLRTAGGTATEFLARVTSTSIMPDVLKDRLVYVIRWDGYVCAPSRGGPVAAAGGNQCTHMTFIDAATGTDLGSVEGPADQYDPNAPVPTYATHAPLKGPPQATPSQ